MDRNKSEKDIRKSYRAASLKYHPDKNKDPEAVQIFLDLSDNMEVLKGKF